MRRQRAPVRRGEHGVHGLGHVVQDPAGLRVVADVFVELAVQALAGELAHVARRIDEEDVVVRQDEIVGDLVFIRRQPFVPGHPEELDRDSDGALQVGSTRLHVAREARPHRVFGRLGEHPDAQLGRQVRPDAKPAVCRAVEAHEHRPRGRIAPRRDRCPLEVVDEQLAQPFDRIRVASARLRRQRRCRRVCVEPRCSDRFRHLDPPTRIVRRACPPFKCVQAGAASEARLCFENFRLD
jgi:hypothetical protein